MLQRNFGEDDYVAVGLNKKFVNEKTGENPFARDFTQVYMRVNALPNYIKSMRKKADVYICFTPVSDKNRVKVNAKDSYLIVQDIDGVPIPEDLKPSYFWETSPGKFQGVWILDNLVTPQEQERINRQLVARYGFDKSSADIVHFYRVPMSINHKYKTDFKVSDLQGDGKVYRKSEFVKFLGKTKTTELQNTAVTSDSEIAYKEFPLKKLVKKYDAVSEFRNLDNISDRSEYSWRLSMKLIKAGATKEELKFILLNLPDDMAKWNQSTVDKEVNRCFSKADFTEGKSELSSIKFSGEKENKNLTWGNFKITKFKDVEELDPSGNWLIEGMWEKGSVGIVGAPPKSFKSTLVNNMVISVASGRPFCGRHVQQGGVLVVLGESNPQHEKAKMIRMMNSQDEDLPIYFVEEHISILEVTYLEKVINDNDIKLLVLDPMYMLLGEDLSDQRRVTQALQLITTLRNKTGCAVILVHHSRKIQRGEKIKPDDLFGTTFINGWYESMILLQRNGRNSSEMKTYFRNNPSGDIFNLHVNPDTMKIRLYENNDGDDWEEQDDKQNKKPGELKVNG